MDKHKPIILSLIALMAIGACTGAANTQPPSAPSATDKIMMLKKMTPILMADNIPACIDFWKTLGLEATATVPGEEGISFAILSNGRIEIMYQTPALAASQNPSAAEGLNKAALYFDVANYDAVLKVAQTHPVVVADHETPYGTREIYVRDPAGNLIGFAGATK